MQNELMHFYTKDGIKLSGLLFRSKRANKSVIINIFGMTSDFFSSDRYTAMVKELKGTNMDLFLGSNRGLGVISGFRKKVGNGKYLGTAKEKFEDCVFDLDATIGQLRKEGYKNMILQGHSTGCQKAIYYQYRRKSKDVKGIILLAPADDFNFVRKSLGKKMKSAVELSRAMVKKGRGDEITPNWISYYSYARFLSYADPRNPEARLFNYDSEMKEFSRIKCPILVVFGNEKDGLTKPVNEHMGILSEKTTSKRFEWYIINGADHGFHGREGVLAKIIAQWATGI